MPIQVTVERDGLSLRLRGNDGIEKECRPRPGRLFDPALAAQVAMECDSCQAFEMRLRQVELAAAHESEQPSAPRSNPASAAAVETVIRQCLCADPPKTIRFTYHDAAGAMTMREAEPYEIKDGKLFAHCLERDSVRQFRLGGISDASVGRDFVPRHPIVVVL